MDTRKLFHLRLLAVRFAECLTEAIGPENVAVVAVRNAQPGRGRYCASHDFCDANMVMAKAFGETFARDALTTTESGASELEVEADVAMWNNAWDLARVAGFHPTAIRDRVDERLVSMATDAALDQACSVIQAYVEEPTGDFAAIYFTGQPRKLVQEILHDYLRQQRRVTCEERYEIGTIGEAVGSLWSQALPVDVLQHDVDSPSGRVCMAFLASHEAELRVHSLAVRRQRVPQDQLSPDGALERSRMEAFLSPVIDVARGILGPADGHRPRHR